MLIIFLFTVYFDDIHVCTPLHGLIDKKAVLSKTEPNATAVNFDTYQILYRAVSLPQHGSTAFLLVFVYRLQTMLVSQKVSEEVATEIAKKMLSSTTL